MQNNACFSLSKKERTAWLCALAALCINFAPFLFNFIWGNHDWLPLMNKNSWLSGLIEGRFSQYIFLNIMLEGQILPILNTFLGFIFYTLALTLLSTRFFKFSSPVAPLLITAAATLPYITEILYFKYIVLSQLIWPLIITLALLTAQKAAASYFLPYTILSTLLLFLTVGGYPAAANLYTTATILWLLSLLQKRPLSLKAFCRAAAPFAISLITSFALLLLSYRYFMRHNLMLALYNSQTPPLTELFLKIPHTIQLAILSLLQPQPFFSLNLKLLIGAIFLLFVIFFLKSTSDAKTLIVRIFLLLCLCLSIKFSAWLAADAPNNVFAQYDPAAFMIRADFYAIPCLVVFCLFNLADRSQIVCKNISYAAAIILLFININSNLTFSKTTLLGFNAENLLLERLISRIQEHPNYAKNNLYTVIQAGELPLRPRYYTPSPFEKYGYYTLNTPLFRHWIAFEYYNFYAPDVFVREKTAIHQTDITPQMIDFFAKKISPWPNPNSLYLDNRYAVIALTPNGQNMLKSQFNLLK